MVEKENPLSRFRITYAQFGAMRYIGHLDLHMVWERAIRRAALPLAYTQGFHPTPRINFAAALPLGFSSTAELMDIYLEQSIDIPEIHRLLTSNIPPGLEIIHVQPVELKSPSMQSIIAEARYRVRFHIPLPQTVLESSLNRLLSNPSIPRTWRKKPYDLRPLIIFAGLPYIPSEPDPILELYLSASEGANARPDEVIDAMQLSDYVPAYERFALILKSPDIK